VCEAQLFAGVADKSSDQARIRTNQERKNKPLPGGRFRRRILPNEAKTSENQFVEGIGSFEPKNAKTNPPSQSQNRVKNTKRSQIIPADAQLLFLRHREPPNERPVSDNGAPRCRARVSILKNLFFAEFVVE
jgi:hypothetical protein